MADQQTQLDAFATELRMVVDQLAGSVADVTDRRRTADDASTCISERNGVRRWSYGLNLIFTGDVVPVGERARALLVEAGFVVRDTPNATDLVRFIALRDGAVVSVAGGADEDRTIISFQAASACVSPDGTVDTSDPP